LEVALFRRRFTGRGCKNNCSLTIVQTLRLSQRCCCRWDITQS